MIETLAPQPRLVAVSYLGNSYTVNHSLDSWPLRRYGSRLRFEVRSGDHTVFGDGTVESSVERSELYLTGATSYPYLTDVWASFAMRVPSYSATPANWQVVWQMHATATPGAGDVSLSPCLALEMSSDGSLSVVTRSFASSPVTTNPSEVVQYTIPSCPRDTWMNWVFQVQFAQTGNGLLNVWKDGSSVYSGTPPVGYNQTTGPYPRFGIYRAATNGTAVVEFDNMELPAAGTSLSARISSPLARQS